MNGLEIIQKERQEQIEKHGYTVQFHIDHPEYYSDNELFKAGLFCLMPPRRSTIAEWPSNWDEAAAIKIVDKDRIGQLACAGAFFMTDQELFGHNNEANIAFCAKCIDQLLSYQT